jgi:hypothetical protein
MKTMVSLFFVLSPLSIRERETIYPPQQLLCLFIKNDL